MDVTDPPDDLVTFEERQYYRKFVQELLDGGTILSVNDRFGLSMLVRNTLIARTAMKHISQFGAAMSVEGDRGTTIMKANPNLNILKDAQTNIRFYHKEFGLTSASKPKLTTPPKGGDDGFDDIKDV